MKRGSDSLDCLKFTVPEIPLDSVRVASAPVKNINVSKVLIWNS